MKYEMIMPGARYGKEYAMYLSWSYMPRSSMVMDTLYGSPKWLKARLVLMGRRAVSQVLVYQRQIMMIPPANVPAAKLKTEKDGKTCLD